MVSVSVCYSCHSLGWVADSISIALHWSRSGRYACLTLIPPNFHMTIPHNSPEKTPSPPSTPLPTNHPYSPSSRAPESCLPRKTQDPHLPAPQNRTPQSRTGRRSWGEEAVVVASSWRRRQQQRRRGRMFAEGCGVGVLGGLLRWWMLCSAGVVAGMLRRSNLTVVQRVSSPSSLA